MTIEHFFPVLLGCIWVYTLLLLTGRLLWDKGRPARIERREALIEGFFAPEHTQEELEHRFKQVRKATFYSSSLLEYYCSCHLAACEDCDPRRQELYEFYLKRVLQKHIARTSPRDALQRCLLLQIITRCGIRSDKIDCFTARCAAGSRLERLWCGHEAEQPEIMTR